MVRVSPAFRSVALFSLLLLFCSGVALFLPHLEVRTEQPLPLLRLHVVAPSDDAADQALKLKVRDAILALLDPQMAECSSMEASREKVMAALPDIQRVAEAQIRAEGYTYTVQPEIGRFFFPKKVYGTLTAPAGEYDALRVVIGSGQGANWWCVLYPPLCLSDRTGVAVTSGLPEAPLPPVAPAVDGASAPHGEGRWEVRSKVWELMTAAP
ncbi:stage II sporulation protein R [Heliophilum fasciatum]|uniref:Stage II sporulation protein R n=1 Tax=Heliophilum fasciatum TaxID=35700 RepID=A0A4R2RXP0_9FIRM|nr:stage II sporulation protein R [Heliophilum fasciatum]TCP63885.1 stage II sporulation protein R [Heliophilum fasciatum]